MKVVTALLADFATVHPNDGKLYITGGGIRSLSFPSFPATQQRISLAVGIDWSGNEQQTPHGMRIEVRGPAGTPILKPLEVAFEGPANIDAARRRYSHFVYNMDGVSFASEGEYAFLVSVDQHPYVEVPLLVVAKAGPFSPKDEADIRLAEGYHAFESGDHAGAEEIFRDVATRFPKVPGGHNNLGFVLLGKGEAAEAIREFEQSKELGFGQSQLTEANIAAAEYLLGNATTALAIFRACLQQSSVPSPSVLFGISSSGLFPVALHSASDYVALMMLNAGWSASKTGDIEAARDYVLASGAIRLTQPEHSSRQRFASSVGELRHQLDSAAGSR